MGPGTEPLKVKAHIKAPGSISISYFFNHHSNLKDFWFSLSDLLVPR